MVTTMSVIDRLAFWRRPALRSYERAVLDAVASRLHGGVRDVYDAQVRLLDASRETLDKEVVLRGLPDCVLQFANRDSEMRLATVRVDSKHTLWADVWVSRGRLLALTFSESPRTLSTNDYTISEIALWEDLASPAQPLELVDMGKVVAWASGLPLADVLGPLPADARTRRLEALASRVPSDWLDMLTVTDGFHICDAKVYGIRGARTVVLDREEVVVLAESDSPTLLVLSRTRSDGHVYLYDLERHELSDRGASLREALRDYLALE